MKIDSLDIQSVPGKAFLVGQGNNGEIKIEVDKEYVDRHAPAVGGYYVEYLGPENYRSYSPAEPFEAGYSEI